MLEPGSVASGPARLAVGDGGLGLVFRVDRAQRVVFVWTDMAGVPVGLPQDIFDPSPDPISFSFVDGVGVIRGEDGSRSSSAARQGRSCSHGSSGRARRDRQRHAHEAANGSRLTRWPHLRRE
jgi:hypothetical protein